MAFPVLTPVLIAFGTAMVGNFFQNKDSKIKQEREHRASTLAAAGQVYDEVSKTMDTLRYYLKEQAIFVAVRAAQEDASRAADDKVNWQAYEDALTTWKTNQNRLISEVEVYFGVEEAVSLTAIGQLFDEGSDRVGATFYKTSNSLVKDKNVDWKAFFDPLESIDQEIRTLNVKLSHLLQQGKVGDL